MEKMTGKMVQYLILLIKTTLSDKIHLFRVLLSYSMQDHQSLRKRLLLPLLMLIMIASLIMASDLIFDRTEGWLLLMGLVALVIWMIQFGLRRGPDDPLAEDFDAEIPKDMPTGYAILWLVVGLIILPMSSEFLVDGAVFIARSLEVSETVIGLTIMAFGTSLPELMTSLIAARRGKADVALGNVLGSNIFNILGILGITAMVYPFSIHLDEMSTTISQSVVSWIDIAAMGLSVGLLFLFAASGRRIGRSEGAILLAAYAAYIALRFNLLAPLGVTL